jgi:hypothetical protein
MCSIASMGVHVYCETKKKRSEWKQQQPVVSAVMLHRLCGYQLILTLQGKPKVI